MVRFIIFSTGARQAYINPFTFQYGQIYYKNEALDKAVDYLIYIPIWLDLLCCTFELLKSFILHLHSNMVRFIIFKSMVILRQNNFIYIPIWLDLLYSMSRGLYISGQYLHSNMVRFIISSEKSQVLNRQEFTFQYGQIYYSNGLLQTSIWVHYLHSNMVRFIIMMLCLIIFL